MPTLQVEVGIEGSLVTIDSISRVKSVELHA